MTKPKVNLNNQFFVFYFLKQTVSTNYAAGIVYRID